MADEQEVTGVRGRPNAPRPYKVVPYDEGDGAEVIERATGHCVGYVLRARNGWNAYLSSAPGWRLPFEWFDRSEDEDIQQQRITEALGWRWTPVLATHYRADAAARVWTAHTEGLDG